MHDERVVLVEIGEHVKLILQAIALNRGQADLVAFTKDIVSSFKDRAPAGARDMGTHSYPFMAAARGRAPLTTDRHAACCFRTCWYRLNKRA